MRTGYEDKRRNQEIPTSFLAQRIQDAMQKMTAQNGETWDVRKLAEVMDVSYEYTRRIVRGEQLPSLPMVNLMSQVLKIDKLELKTLYSVDKIRRDFGTIPMQIAGKNPELEPIERVWEYLTDEHKKLLVKQAQTYAKIDRLATSDILVEKGEK